MTTINERVAMVVADSKLTKTAFAAKLNVSTAFISKICSGDSNLSDRTISDICRIFDIREEWLRDGLEPMRSAKSKEEEIAELVGAALSGSNEFKKSVIRMICSRSDAELKALEDALRAVYDGIEKEKNQG